MIDHNKVPGDGECVDWQVSYSDNRTRQDVATFRGLELAARDHSRHVESTVFFRIPQNVVQILFMAFIGLLFFSDAALRFN